MSTARQWARASVSVTFYKYRGFGAFNDFFAALIEATFSPLSHSQILSPLRLLAKKCNLLSVRKCRLYANSGRNFLS